MSWQIGSVTLPHSPSVCMIKYSQENSEYVNPGSTSWVFSIGRKPDFLTMKGELYVAGWPRSTLLGSYVNPLLNQLGTVVAIIEPGTVYSGTYFLLDIVFEERAGEFPLISYSFEFKKGGYHQKV